MSSESVAITVLLDHIRLGASGADEQLVALLYDQFRQRARRRLRRERPGHTLGTDDLAQEALIRLVKNDEFAKAADRHQLFRAFARAVRQALYDHARHRDAQKGVGDRRREDLDELMEDVRHHSGSDVVSLHESLGALAVNNPREAEVLEMKYFGGYEMAEIAEALAVHLSTVEKAHRFARNWLKIYLTPETLP